MTECEEVAMQIAFTIRAKDLPETMCEARELVRHAMGEQTGTIIDNVAEALLEYRDTDHPISG